MICEYCGNTRATKTSTGCRCNKCGIESYDRRGNLYRYIPQSRTEQILQAIDRVIKDYWHEEYLIFMALCLGFTFIAFLVGVLAAGGF